MDAFAFRIGTCLMELGGFVLVVCILCLLGFGLCCAWIAFSDTFRRICDAESLIWEYRKHREKFLEWYKMEGNNG